MNNFSLLLLLFVHINIYAQDDIIIKTKPLKSNEVTLTEEQIFVQKNFPFISIDEWSKGMPFYAYDIKNKKYISIEIDSIVKEDEYNGTHGQIIKPFIYKFSGKNSSFQASERITDSTDNIEHILKGNIIYWIIYVGDIAKARELLTGKTFYILTDDWNVDGENCLQKNIKSRFVPVLIKKIGVSDNPSYPVKVIFEASDRNEYYVNVKLSGINSGGTSSAVFGKDFANTFTFKNPKTKYPKITQTKWKLISKGKVQIGMSKDECILSWGHPKSINTTTNSYGVNEQWVYGEGSYLYFKDGKLSSVQN